MKKFFIKLSKPGLIRLIAQSKARPRMMQVVILCMSWSRCGTRPIGHKRKYGFHAGKLCFDNKFMTDLKNFTGLEHNQVRKYLNELKKLNLIFEQYSLEGGLEYIFNPDLCLIPKPGEKYIIFNLSGAGHKSFDILSALESALIADAHPAEDTAQLRFNIPERTRRYRQSKHKNRQKKLPRQKKSLLPVYSLRNIHKTTEVDLKKTILLKISTQDTLKIPWFETKKLSENAKVLCGMATGDRGLWHKGQIFRFKPGAGYKLLPGLHPKPAKEPAKEDFFVPNIAHTARRIFPPAELEKANKQRFNPP